METMKEPSGSELSFHFFSVHGGWYENGIQVQVVKQVQQEDHPNMTTALEAQELHMLAQLELFTPKGLNLR